MKSKWFHKAVTAATVLGAILAPALAHALGEINPDLIRLVELQWEPQVKAVEYEFDLGTNPEFTNPLFHEVMKETKFRANLLPGAYYYRVRGIDRFGKPGRWTAIQELNINARPPVLISPPNQTTITGNLPDDGLTLDWRSSGPGIRYLIEIRSKDAMGKYTNVVAKQEVYDNEFPFFPQEPGSYQWSVHTLGAGGDEPGLPWELNIEGVFPRPSFPEPGMQPRRIVRYVPPWWRGHWTLFARYGQANLHYSIVDQDERATSSFSGITGFTTWTLNWEWHDAIGLTKGVPWFELEYELDRQTVLFESVLLPRYKLRLGNWYDEWKPKWRFSPVLELGQRELAIYQPRSPVLANRTNTVRSSIGLGAAAEYQLKSYLTLMSSLSLKYDFGGRGGLYPYGGNYSPQYRAGDLLSSMGLEAVAGATMAMGRRVVVQGRFRFESDAANWNGVFPTASGDPVTHVSLTNLSFDTSVGVKF